MKVLIIGGTGLISTAITKYLMSWGYDVMLYNRGIRELQFEDKPKVIIGDRQKYSEFESQMLSIGNFDCVIDMICFVPQEAESAVRAFKGRIGQFIFCSTVDVYTKPANCYPIKEDEEKNPRKSFPYAYNKALCEKIFIEAQEKGYFPVTIIRPAHTYGEGAGLVHPPGFGSIFLDRIRKGKPIIIHGDGNSLWSVCHRDDVGYAFASAVGNKKAFNNDYHVTGDEWLTWNKYHLGIASAMGVPDPPIVHIPTDLLSKIMPTTASWCVENFQFNNIFDNSKAKDDLGFKYTITWIEGVKRVIKWLDDHNRIENSDNDILYDKLILLWENLVEKMEETFGSGY